MADPLPPLQDPSHASAWSMAYLDGELSEADRATFEEHMKSHGECREHVGTMRAALPALVRVLMEAGPPRTGAEYAELARAAEAKLKAKQTASPHPSLSPAWRKFRWPIWGGLGFAGLAAAAASVLVVLDPFTAGLEPELLRAAQVEMAPARDDAGVEPILPPPPVPAKLELSAVVRFDRLELGAPRFPTDIYTAVVLIDSRGRGFVAQPGDKRDPTCTPGCGELKLRVELDKLAPGPFRVAVLASTTPRFKSDLEDFLKDPTEAEAGRLHVRAYGIANVR
jgi:hypothetical protein